MLFFNHENSSVKLMGLQQQISVQLLRDIKLYSNTL